MLLLGVDFETTGLLVNEDRIIEVGAVIWDTERQHPVQIYSALVEVPVDLSPEIIEITGITGHDLKAHGVEPTLALSTLMMMFVKCEAIVAHNGTTFDKPLLFAECQRHGFPAPSMHHWIDTSLDVPYPAKIKTRSLVHLAAEHGFVNPFPHRAVADVLTMLKLLSHYNAEEVLRISKEPNVTLIALVKEPWKDAAPTGRKESDKAKARGYRFNGERKTWEKVVKESALLYEQSHGEFDVKIVRT